MKQFRIFFSVLLLWVGGANVLFAQSGDWSTNTYEADGIYYYLNNTTREAQVARGNYSGEIVIPEYIWPEHPGSQDALVQTNNPYWGGYRVTDYTYVKVEDVVTTPFSNNSNITKVTLPQSIRSIKDGTFMNCTQLEEVKLIGCFFANSYSTVLNSPTGTQSVNVFSGCANLRRMYADDPRVVCAKRRWNEDAGKSETYCPLEDVLGTNTTTNLALYHNAGVKLAPYFSNKIVKQEQTTFTNSKLQVTIDFFPNGDVSYIDYDYTLNSLNVCKVTKTSHAITERQTAIDCPKQGSKTFVLRNVPQISPYLKPYIQVGNEAPVPMCIFSDTNSGETFYYTVNANPDADSNTKVSIFYMSSGMWDEGIYMDMPDGIDVYVNNQRKFNNTGINPFFIECPGHPYTTYDIALNYDPERYTVKAYDANNNEYELLDQYNGIIAGQGFRYGIKYFRTTGSGSFGDYKVKVTATDIPMQILYYGKPKGTKLTVSGYRKGVAFTTTYKNTTNYFSADPEKTVNLRLDGVPAGLEPYVIAARERLELTKVTEGDITYYTTSYVPHYNGDNSVEIGTTQIIADGEILSVNITKAGNGLFWIQEQNEDWYEAIDDDSPEQLHDMEMDGDTQSFEWPYAYNNGNVQKILFIAPMSETAEGIVESVHVNVNGVDVEPIINESGNGDGDTWYSFFVPISEHLDIMLIHETNARSLQVKNDNGNGNITIYDAEGIEQLTVPNNVNGEIKDLVRKAGYYAIIQPKAKKEVSAIFTSGMQELLPPANYLLSNGTYYVPLADFNKDGTNNYQLSVLYAEQSEVEPWIYAVYDPIYNVRFDNWWYTLPESHRRAVKGMKINDWLISPALKILRDISGQSFAPGVEPFCNNLKSLDMTNAKLRMVSDMYFYRNGSIQYGINQDNVWPAHFLEGMEIDTLWLPKALVSIEQGAFDGAKSSLVVYAPWKTPLAFTTSNVFGDEVATMRLYVPAGSFEAYVSDKEWGKFGYIEEYGSIDSDIIQFADANVKAICVEHWDTDGDHELSVAEAKAVTTLMDGDVPVFKDNATIVSFNELRYFTGLTSIEDKAFYDCQSLASVVLPSTITSIGKFAFFRCSRLEFIDLPTSLQTINNHAFRVSGLKTLFIPKNVTTIGVGITGYCQNLVSIVVDGENGKFKSTNGCNGIILSGNALKAGCQYTKIPEGVNIIQEECFYFNNALETIEIPSTVTKILSSAFQGCRHLKSIVSKAAVPPALLSLHVFSDFSTDCVLTVPNGTKEAYIQAGWTTKETDPNGIFLRIEEAPSNLEGDVNNDNKVTVADAVKVVNIIMGNE